METEKMLPLQSGVFDLDTMSDVTLYKDVPFTPVETLEEARQRLGNDAKRLLAVINDGLESETRKAAKTDDSIPWYSLNDENEKEVFTGTPADSKAVNGLVLNLAKSVFGYTKTASIEEKRTAKDAALQMIKATDAIREGLKKNAAL